MYYHRRTRLEIMKCILMATLNGAAKPTHIMNEAGVNWPSVQRFLEYLVGAGYIELIELDRSKKSWQRYTITSAGFNLLSYLEEAQTVIAF